MNKKEHRHRPMVGGSALIVIFAVLCLVTFALLMLATESSAGRLSEVSAKASAEYYEADRRAEITFASLRAGELPTHVTADGGHFSYSEKISDTRYLHVELTCEDGSWTVLRWQALSTVR